MAVEVIRSKTRKTGALRKRWEFALEFYRDEQAEQHAFLAYPAMDAGSLNFTLSATRNPERAIEGMTRAIRKCLADDDGTPASYRPTRYVEPEEAPDDSPAPDEVVTAEQSRNEFLTQSGFAVREPEIVQELAEQRDRAHEVVARHEAANEDDEAQEVLFAGPNGEPLDDAAVSELLKFENGSSRRRFAYLMDEDDTLTLEMDQLQTVYKKLLAQVTDRPTRR